MPTICYEKKRFGASSLNIIRQANDIIAEYDAQGFDLTLRQLYYQFVSRDLIANKQSEYKRLGGIINDARLAGLIDWDHITDRTRNLRSNSHWDSPEDIVGICARTFAVDKWKGQKYRPEVWIEKDALAGVFERICTELDVPYFSCRGYTSQSEMWSAARRLEGHVRKGQTPIILHFGDHDPSGIDMSRDIRGRLNHFMCGDLANEVVGEESEQRVSKWWEKFQEKWSLEGPFEVRRLALNMAQVEQYGPPPNPAKTTDARYRSYQEIHGDESWELDALDPTTLADLVRDEIMELRDDYAWEEAEQEQAEGRRLLGEISSNWSKITRNL